MIRQAKASKAQIYALPGNEQQLIVNHHTQPLSTEPSMTVEVDQNYVMVGAHIDSNIQDKIQSRSYVDFAKLLPKGFNTDDHRLELIYKGVRRTLCLHLKRTSPVVLSTCTNGNEHLGSTPTYT